MGYSIQELAESCTFEEVTYLLLYGELPKQAERDSFSERMRAARAIKPEIIQMIKDFPRQPSKGQCETLDRQSHR